MISKYFINWLFVSLICSCCYSQKDNNKKVEDTIVYKTTLIPLKVVQPTELVKTLKAEDSCYLNLFISNGALTVTLFNRFTKLENKNSLDTFLINNKERVDKTKVLIVNDKNGSVEKFKEVVASLKRNGITKFRIISR